ncbi:DUF2264 domain-containing protein [Bacteroides acidifaciens]|uniref:DUF2264 domain-containing protein n=1 Tax=Bacteroides acidifaciens TaxID=85831 RepID=UPI003336D258
MECFGQLMAGLAPWLSLADDDTPERINPTQTTPRMGKGQVRAGMTAVIKRMFGNNRNLNTKDFLTLGFNGSQAGISDYYTNNGSLYMASLTFLPLGLPADDPFWTDALQPWTSKKA